MSSTGQAAPAPGWWLFLFDGRTGSDTPIAMIEPPEAPQEAARGRQAPNAAGNHTGGLPIGRW